MDTLYIDCRMGVTGTKLLGALVDVMENPDLFVYNFNKLGMESVSMQRLPDALSGITGSQVEFKRRSSDELDPYADEIDADEADEYERRRPRHRSRTLEDIIELIEDLPINDDVCDRAIRIYEKIAHVSSKINNRNINEMKMRRTGSRDVIATVVAVCMALDELKPDHVIVSTIAVGDGYVHTPRGKMPVPTPEVQMLLECVPYTAGTESGELTSLEGAALIAEIADEFGSIPEMTIAKSGAGFGRRTFKSGVNCVRAYQGKSLSTAANESYIELCAEMYGTDKADLSRIAKELDKIGVVSAHVSDISDLDGNSGLMLKVIADAENADLIATYILEKTAAKRVTRMVVNAYTL